MKTKSTNLMPRLIGAVLVCGAAGFWFSASQLPRRQAAPPTPSTMGTLPTVISISSRPAATKLRIAPTGWVVDTADATTRAVVAANQAARRDYGSEPFTEVSRQPHLTGDGGHGGNGLGTGAVIWKLRWRLLPTEQSKVRRSYSLLNSFRRDCSV